MVMRYLLSLSLIKDQQHLVTRPLPNLMCWFHLDCRFSILGDSTSRDKMRINSLGSSLLKLDENCEMKLDFYKDGL